MELTELEKKILDSKMRELEDTIIVKTLDKIAEKIAEDLYVPVYQKLITKVAENYNQQIKTSVTPKIKDFRLPDLPKMPSDFDSTITKSQFRTIATNDSSNGINTIHDEFNDGNSRNTIESVKQQCNMNNGDSSPTLDKQQNIEEESSKIKEVLRPVKQPELDNAESERTNSANFKKLFDYLTSKKSDIAESSTQSSTESIHKKNNIDNNQYNQRNKSKVNNESEQSTFTQTTQHQSKSQSNGSSEKKNLTDKDKQRQEAKEKINNIINALFGNSMHNNDKISSGDILTPDEIEALLQLKFPQNMVEDFDRIFCDFFNIIPNKKF